MQSLTQLASVSGPVFEDDENLLKYITHYMTCLLGVINLHQWSEHQALGLANIIFRLCDVSPIKVLSALPQQLITTFFEAMTFLGCRCLEASVNIHEDIDNEYMEAGNVILDSWVIVVSHTEEFPSSLVIEHCYKIVMSYISIHLAPPSGIRKPGWDDEDIDTDLVDMDRDSCSDELSNIGHLARQCLPQVLPTLIEKIDERVVALRQILENIAQGAVANGNNDDLFEDVHWLILVSTFVLTTEQSGESAQLPTEIIEYSNQYLTANSQSVSTSVHYFSSMGKNGDGASVDKVIGLITALFKVILVEMDFLKNGMNAGFSPEVSSSLVWFLKRFVNSYLTSSTDVKLSPTLMSCFDLKQDCGKFVIKTILEITEVNLSVWSSEPQVSEDTTKLLLRMLSEKARVQVCLSFDTVWNISKKFAVQSQDIAALSPHVNRHLVHSLIRACTCIENPQMQQDFQVCQTSALRLS